MVSQGSVTALPPRAPGPASSTDTGTGTEDPATAGKPGRAHRWSRQPGWFLTAIFIGIPVWWVLGVTEIVFFALSIPMLFFLMRLRDVECPRGTGVWLLFLVWLLSGLFVMQVDAPGAEPGASTGRYLVFGYRFAWYLVATVALLYVTNTRRLLSTQRISWAISWLYVSLIIGGILGLLLPRLEFQSALELVLPGSIANQDFVNSLIHPRVAQLQDFLGYEQPRPTAPFFFANQWGINVAVTLPHFIVSWWRREGLWRVAMVAVLVVSAYPVVASLNRTMWGALAVAAAFVVVQLALRGHLRLFVLMAGGMVLSLLLLAASPLGDLVVERFNNPHSDEGRGNLVDATVRSTLTGSPVIGFGTTRDVAGNFASIAGGASAECPNCTPPPLGTHGQVWLLLFAGGLGSLVLFLGFFVGQMVRRLRDDSPYTLAAQATMVAFFVMLPFYPAVQSAIVIAMLSVGIMHREAPRPATTTMGRLVRPARQHLAWVVACAVLGGALGAAVPALRGTVTTATSSVLVPADLQVGDEESRLVTMDAEAAMAASGPVLDAVAEATGATDRAQVADALSFSAPPNTRVLEISYSSRDRVDAVRGAEAAARAYVRVRTRVARDARTVRTDVLEGRLEGLAGPLSVLQRASAGMRRAAGVSLGPTAAELWARPGRLAEELTSTGATPARATVVGERVRESSDPWVVATGSGVAVGGAVALLLAWAVGDRWGRMRQQRAGDLVDGVPVLLHLSEGPEHEQEGRLVEAAGTYQPFAGVLADPGSVTTARWARRVNDVLARTGPPEGSRALLLLEAGATTGAAQRLVAWCRSCGLDPVGIVVVEPGSTAPEVRVGTQRAQEAPR